MKSLFMHKGYHEIILIDIMKSLLIDNNTLSTAAYINNCYAM